MRVSRKSRKWENSYRREIANTGLKYIPSLLDLSRGKNSLHLRNHTTATKDHEGNFMLSPLWPVVTFV